MRCREYVGEEPVTTLLGTGTASVLRASIPPLTRRSALITMSVVR